MASRQPSWRPIKRLLVANRSTPPLQASSLTTNTLHRGEIATRILQSAHELNLETFALTTTNDTTHALHASHTIHLPSASSYLDISAIISIARVHNIDAIHPGYGFLSESAEFVRRAWDEAGVVVIGPGADILERTGDKLAAKVLADECGVPTLAATRQPTRRVEDIQHFARDNGYPVMLKAVDGGGGKGIRLVREEKELENAFKRATAESPSKSVFVEKAAVDGFYHIEVQIVGDDTGEVAHLHTRDCSIQRRYQKIVEIAPGSFQDREFIARIVDAAVTMAEKINYLSLGTFEFLANPVSQEFFFLEVNPRLQVEHTITECITSVDLVKIQLEIAQGASLHDTDLAQISPDKSPQFRLSSVELRLTAEDPHSNWSLSIGRISSFRFPTGNGIRIDTHLVAGHPTVVGADFDSLLAKIIVTGSSWPATVAKCRRALEDTLIVGVKTNVDILRAIVASEDFEERRCDTGWLERNMESLLKEGERISRSIKQAAVSQPGDEAGSVSNVSSGSNSSLILRRGDAWAIQLSPLGKPSSSSNTIQTHHLKLSRVLRNEFPSLIRAEIEYTQPGASAPLNLLMDASSSQASSSAIMGNHRRGNSNDPNHVVIPFPGKLVEVLVDEGDVVKEGDVIVVLRMMKMEVEVRARKSGVVKWITEAEDGEDVIEGTLAAELGDEAATQNPDRARL